MTSYFGITSCLVILIPVLPFVTSQSIIDPVVCYECQSNNLYDDTCSDPFFEEGSVAGRGATKPGVGTKECEFCVKIKGNFMRNDN